ncbi:PDZ domain-containing protein [Pseudanabaenaceae cyanobacterium LEGE 13415]|nr:PDZ domain-containing protein [Pseudanabaenaceae cyanobacterium LEGE 13415]
MVSFQSIRTLSLVGLTGALALTTFFNRESIASTISFRDSPKAVLDQAWQIVDQTYVDRSFNHVDWQQVRQQLLSKNYTSRDAAYAALKGALKQLNDPYTRFLTPTEFQALNSEDINGELTGVGLQLETDQKTKAIKVVKVLNNSPALKAGVRPGDTLLAIDGHRTQGMAIEQATKLIRGQANTQVKFLLGRAKRAPFSLAITRQQIQLPVVTAALRQQNNQRIGYIRLDEFSGHAAEQMQQAITNLDRQHVDRFVLDLRGNPGGLLDQETAIARMWLNQGTIVRIVDRDGAAEEVQANRTALTNRPLAILVDGGSASASEILTGALKDNQRAVVVGTQTFGKALVQSVNPLPDGSGINVTIAHYFTPSGLDINHRGITPNVVIPLTQQQKQELSSHPDELGTSRDSQYERALSALTTQ